jgi:hypothetical protein
MSCIVFTITGDEMITITDKTIGLWYLDTIPGKQDWLAAITEIVPDSQYELVYRFRYYKDDKAFDSEDIKNWFRVAITGTKAYTIASMREVAKTMLSKSTGKLSEILNEGDTDKFMQKLMDSDFAYAKMATPQEVP